MLKLCVNVMCEYKQHLYPMVHRCWPVLQQRLNDEDPFIVPQAFKVPLSVSTKSYPIEDLILNVIHSDAIFCHSLMFLLHAM